MRRSCITTAHRWTVIALACALLTATACGGPFNATNCGHKRFASLKISLPPSAATVSESCSDLLYVSYEVRFTMTPQDLAAFQQSTLIQQWQANPAAVTTFKAEAARAKSLLFGSFSYPNHAQMQEILIDTSDPQQYKVYFTSSQD